MKLTSKEKKQPAAGLVFQDRFGDIRTVPKGSKETVGQITNTVPFYCWVCNSDGRIMTKGEYDAHTKPGPTSEEGAND